MRGFGRVTAYATRSDLYSLALRKGVLGNDGREIASSIASTDTLTLNAHLFETDDAVTLRAAEDGTLSAPLVAGATYYAIRVTDNAFQLAATVSGAAIDLTTNGADMFVMSALPYDRLLEVYSRFVDDFIPHLVPLTAPYPDTVVLAVCELTAARLMILDGKSSESMAGVELATKAKLERWAKGIPVRDATVTASANLAVCTTAEASDPRGWGSGTLP